MVRGGERGEWSKAGVNETAFWLRPETRCHPETHASALKEGRGRRTSIRPLHRSKQDVWTQLRTSQTPLQSKSYTATMSRSTYSIGPDKIYGCLCAGILTYLCTSTDLYLPVRPTAWLVCWCLHMFDYVSRLVYINEIEILLCMCWYARACVRAWVCIGLFACMCVYDGGGERWRVEN